MTRLLLVAGEASGDLQGALLSQALKALEPDIELIGVGGREMESAGVHLRFRSETMAVTGLWEVLAHLPRLKRTLDALVSYMREDPPDGLITIDYPDFNIRLAQRAQRAGVPVIYYISPQVWAWRGRRVRALAEAIRRMIVIFPFEEEIYVRAGIPVTYVGHPLVDRVRPSSSRDVLRAGLGVGPNEMLVALLPGSRAGEIARILPPMLEARALLHGRAEIHWALAVAQGVPIASLPRSAREDPGLKIRSGETYDILAAADLALTASGTATTEAALLGTPMIVVYRMHPLTWHIARRLVKVPHIAMANILAGRRLVPELLQDEVDGLRLAREVERLLADPALLQSTRAGLLQAAASLGPGGAPGRAAAAILQELAR